MPVQLTTALRVVGTSLFALAVLGVPLSILALQCPLTLPSFAWQTADLQGTVPMVPRLALGALGLGGLS